MVDGLRECRFRLPDEAATDDLGARLAAVLSPGLVIFLEGDLGVGKTTLVRAILRALGYAGPVKSPTYALVELYKLSSLCLYHFDFYRFNDPEEFFDAGLAEYFREDAVCCVEWPEKAAGVVPAPDLRVCWTFEKTAADSVGRPESPPPGAEKPLGRPGVFLESGVRQIFLQAVSALGASCLSRLVGDRPDPAAN